MNARKQDVTYWLTLVFIAVGIVAVILFLFRDRLAARKMEQETVRTRQAVSPAEPRGPEATPTSVSPGEDIAEATATATATPRKPVRASVAPTATPDRRASREDAIRLRQMTEEWVYRGYAQMGPRGIGSFSRSKKEGGTFTAIRGDEIEGITVDSVDRTRAVLRLGQATVDLLIKPEEPKPTPVPRVRSRTRRPPVGDEPGQPRQAEPEQGGELVEQETPFEQ